MDGLDEVQRALGRIEGAVKALTDNVANSANKQDKLSEEVIEQRGAIKLLSSQNVEMAKAVEDYKAVKNRSIGAMFGLSLASGSVGAGAVALVQRLLSSGTPPLPPGHGG